MSPEEAEAFLASQRLKRKTKDIPAPPKNLSSADLNDWYGQQRQRELEERRKREEAEAYLRGYRADFVESKGLSPDAKSHFHSSPVYEYPRSKDVDTKDSEDEIGREVAGAIIVEEVVDCSEKMEEKVVNKNNVDATKDDTSEKTSDRTDPVSSETTKESEDVVDDIVNIETVIIAAEVTNDNDEEIVDKVSDSVEKDSPEKTVEIEEKVATEVDPEKNVKNSEELTKSLVDDTTAEVEANGDVKENEEEDVVAAEELVEKHVSWSSWICEGMRLKMIHLTFSLL